MYKQRLVQWLACLLICCPIPLASHPRYIFTIYIIDLDYLVRFVLFLSLVIK